MSERIYVGVDLGGTTIKVGLCDREGRLLKKYEGPTGTEGGAEVVIANINAYVRKLVQEAGAAWDDVAGIGVGIPGFMDMEAGVVMLAPNLVWRNVPAKEMLEAVLHKPVILDNDANVAALGEAWSGAGKGIRNLVCLTLGTGVGGGIIMNGSIYQGFKGAAGELGHIQVVPDLEAVQCGCGQMGCVETVSSATGIIRMAKDAVERGDKTSLALQDQEITAKDVFDAARLNDEVALRIVNRAAFYLGTAMAIMAVVLNPQLFIIGGGVSKAGDILFEPLRENFRRFTPEASRQGVEIVAAELGNDAGVIGAAGLNLHQTH